MSEPKFSRYIGIDYSGAAEIPRNLKKGLLRIYMTSEGKKPKEILPLSQEHWTRKSIAKWLVERLSENRPTLVGIDHGFSFPLDYFDRYNLKHDRPERDWQKFLEDFQHHWPTDEDENSVESVLKGEAGDGVKRWGFPGWLRLTEKRIYEAKLGQPKSVFRFGQGTVTYATCAGIPWLRFMRRELKQRCLLARFWPFDGWEIPENCSAIVEVYPALWKKKFAQECSKLDNHQRDAYCVAAWMSESDHNGRLDGFLKPKLKQAESKQARIEGWILGIA